MGVANTVFNSVAEYRQVLEDHSVVFAFFFSASCPACEIAYPTFKTLSDQFADRVKVLILDAANTPRIDEVTGFPTLVVYEEAKVVENLKGIGYPEEQQQILNDLFGRYTPA